MFMYLLPVIAIISIAICFSVAKKRRASLPFWVAMGAFLGPLAVPLVFFSKPVMRKIVI